MPYKGYPQPQFSAQRQRLQATYHLTAGNLVAYNPSFEWWKSEDTAVITPDGIRLLTLSPHWPILTFEIGGTIVQRPAILMK